MLSTLVILAIEERKAKSIDQPVADFGWPLAEKDRPMTFRHLASMTSGYARPDAPGAAWAYNDYAIMLYQQTLFDKVLAEDPSLAANARLRPAGIADGLRFRSPNRRLFATVRDFGRIAWYWLERSGAEFKEYCRPQTSANLPHTAKAGANDYLAIGTYGGDSDHFTDFGAGIYGCNWWFNATGRLHPDARTWPGAPDDTFMSIGAGGNCAAMIPSRRLALACARGQWGRHEPGNASAPTARHIRVLLEAFR